MLITHILIFKHHYMLCSPSNSVWSTNVLITSLIYIFYRHMIPTSAWYFPPNIQTKWGYIICIKIHIKIMEDFEVRPGYRLALPLA